MKLRMAENSLFAILLRSRWWLSVLVGAGVVAVALAVAPRDYRAVAAFGALPFFVIAAIAAWRQLRAPSPSRILRTREAAQAMSWPQWAEALQRGFERDGWRVERADGGADLVLTRGGRSAVVGCRRWRIARVGVEPLRELVEAGRVKGADERLYVALGDPTEQARAFAASARIRLIGPAELAALLPELGVRGAGTANGEARR